MIRERGLKVVLVLVGLAFIAGAYLLLKSLLGQWDMVPGDQMILGIYVPMGVFLLLAARNPSANRTLILCVGWINLAHDAVMTVQWYQNPKGAPSDVLGLSILALISLALIVLAPPAPKRETTSGAGEAGMLPGAVQPRLG